MENEHYNDDDLLETLYGIRPPDEHLDACGECRARLERLRSRHEQVRLSGGLISPELLIRQRQAIYHRLGQKQQRFPLRLAPSLAALLLLFVLLFTFRPVSQKEPADISDSEVFEDVFAAASSTEPTAFEPVRSLFEAQQ